MIQNKDFVLEANYLRDHYGNSVLVSSTINFVSIDSTTAVIQIGSNWGLGQNGVGGITAKRNISNWKLKENEKNESFYASATVMTPIGIYDLHFNINASGYSTVRLTGLTRGQLTFEGQVVPYSQSRVYEGMSY